jgi:CheY-like chemotaxis protein
MNTGTILIAEDDANDAFFFERAVRKSGGNDRVISVSNGQEVIDYLTRSRDHEDPDTSPLPTVVVLDLRMPKKTGFEALEWIRAHAEFEFLKVAILTGSTNPRDKKEALEKGADFFASKSDGEKAYSDTLTFIKETLAIDWALAGAGKEQTAKAKRLEGKQVEPREKWGG